ncbi:MAG: DUF1751 domain-containing protein [Bacillota bacterium]
MFFLHNPLFAFGIDKYTIPNHPWTLVAYPLFNPEPVGLVFSMLALWLFGGSMEIIWGTRRYLWRLLLITVTTGLALWLGMLLGFGLYYEGFYVVDTAIIVAWALHNPGQIVMMNLLFPLQGKWLAVISLFIQFFAMGHPVMGILSLSGSLTVYFRCKSPFKARSKYQSPYRESWWDNLRRRLRRRSLKRIK